MFARVDPFEIALYIVSGALWCGCILTLLTLSGTLLWIGVPLMRAGWYRVIDTPRLVPYGARNRLAVKALRFLSYARAAGLMLLGTAAILAIVLVWYLMIDETIRLRRVPEGDFG